MGNTNGTTNTTVHGLKKKHINLRFLKNQFNIVKLKMGKWTNIPLNYITNDDIKIEDLRGACYKDDNLRPLNLQCVIHHIDKWYCDEWVASFSIPKYKQPPRHDKGLKSWSSTTAPQSVKRLKVF